MDWYRRNHERTMVQPKKYKAKSTRKTRKGHESTKKNKINARQKHEKNKRLFRALRGFSRLRVSQSFNASR